MNREPIGNDGRLLLRTRHQQEAATQAKVIAQVARETDKNVLFRPSSDDKNARLRGIPAVGPNVSGEMRDTRPDRAVRDA